MIAAPPRATSNAARRGVIACSILALVAVFVLRLSGPSDLYDQTQPKTIAYTTDILVHGGTHWILPIERGELPATKPPLYNWLAAPAVKLLGFHSEIAHKFPSVAAMMVCWLLLVRCVPRRMRDDAGRDESAIMGWLAGLLLVSSYAIFKLAYLARPDMLLTLWMLIAWMCATGSLIRARDGASRPADVIGFWFAVALAGLTKGPAALMAVLYAVVAARVIAGRWSAVRALQPIVGGACALLICGAWVFAVWKIDPEHLKHELWFNEIFGRFTGRGEEGTAGRGEWLSETPYQSFYYITRFLPWSLLAVLAGWSLWRERRLAATTSIQWMRGAAIMIVIVVGLFSLSVGKRADYVAVAYPQSALLAAWWLVCRPPRMALRWPWLAPAAAAISLTALAAYDHKQIWAPRRGFGDSIRQFIDDATAAIVAQPGPVIHCSAGQTHLQAALGMAEGDQRKQVSNLVARGEAFWVVAGRTQNPPYEFDQWLQQRRMNADAVSVVRSADLPREAGWPGQVTLWRVTPRR